MSFLFVEEEVELGEIDMVMEPIDWVFLAAFGTSGQKKFSEFPLFSFSVAFLIFS